METSGIGKMMVVAGAVLMIVGALFVFSDRLPFLKSIGRLPGDLNWKGDNWQIHFPLMTSLILSIVLSAIFWIVSWLNSRGGR